MFLPIVILLVCCCTSSIIFVSGGGDFFRDFDVAWGDGRARMLDDGQLLTLSLDQTSGSSVQSRNEYLFGRFDMQLKLVPGNSAGTVTSFYLSSHGLIHDEIDFEFLGNLSGDPYVLHTNVFTRGGGGREQQFYLWFDPTADFHTYSIIWTPLRIVFAVDGTPIREFRNLELVGVPFANKQPMRVYASLWNAEYWATRGGRVRIDWTKAPFTASYRRFNDINACVWSSSAEASSNCTSNLFAEEEEEELDFMVEESLKWVEKNYMIYNYCTDAKKYPRGLPAECAVASSTEQNVVSI